MNKTTQIITLDYDLTNHYEFIKLKNEKKLSTTINHLLRSYLNVKKDELPQELDKVKEELYRVEAKKGVLLEKLEELKVKQPVLTMQERADGWYIDPTTNKKMKRLL